MTKQFCDICGRELQGHEGDRYKIKKYHWCENRWKRLSVHAECWKDLCMEIAKRREDNG